MKKIITSIDVGSNSIKLVVGEIYKNELNILACLEEKSKGIKKGLIVEPETTFETLKNIFERAQEIIGIKIKKIIACVPSYYAEFMNSDGYTLITREDRIINGDDIVRSLQACVYNKVNPNKELVSIMPTKFFVNETEEVDNPTGIKASKLTTECVLALAPKKNIYVLLSLLENLGVSVQDICFNSLADYYEFKTLEMNNSLGAVINIGSETTEVSIIDKGVLIATEVLPFGGKSIDKDIVYIYNIYRKDAALLKERYASCYKNNVSSKENEEVVTRDGTTIKVNQFEISEIIYARVKEMLEMCKKQINLLTNKEVCYIIITGGTAELDGFKFLSEEVMGKNVMVPIVKEFGCRSNKYSSALGIIKYYNQKLELRGKFATTLEGEEQKELFTTKKKFNNNILGKIYGYFFDN